MAAHRLAPCEPLPLLCLAVSQLTQALSKKVPNRDRAVLTAFAFLQARLRARALCLPLLCSNGCQAPKVSLDATAPSSPPPPSCRRGDAPQLSVCV